MTSEDIVRDLTITVIKKVHKPGTEDPADWAINVYYGVKNELGDTPVSSDAFQIARLVVEKEEVDLGDRPGKEAARIYKAIELDLRQPPSEEPHQGAPQQRQEGRPSSQARART